MALSLIWSQVIDWPVSFLSPVFTALLLSLPLPNPTLRVAVYFSGSMLAAILLGHLLLALLDIAPLSAVLLVGLVLFTSFYGSAQGGSHLKGTFIVLSVTMVAAIGSVSIDLYIELTKALAKGLVFAFAWVWVAHLLIPDPPGVPLVRGGQGGHALDRREAVRRALRALAVVMPVAILLLCISSSASYFVAMIKVATLGEQATYDDSRGQGRMMLESTAWAGWAALSAGWC